MSAELTYRNFLWRIESTSPQAIGRIVSRFRRYDPYVEEPGAGSGWHRRFFVEWSATLEADDATDISSREADFSFLVHVIYALSSPNVDLMRAALVDRHALVKSLRDHRYYDGVDDAAPAAATGQIGPRRAVRSSLTRVGEYLRLTIEFETRIREGEN